MSVETHAARLDACRSTGWGRAWLREVQALLADPASPSEWVAAVRGRVLDREGGFFTSHVLPGVGPETRAALLKELDSGSERVLAVLWCSLHAMADYRPFLIAEEACRASPASLAARLRADGVAHLSPRGYFSRLLGREDLESLLAALPSDMSRPPDDWQGLDEIRNRADGVQAGARAVSPAAAAAGAAWQALLARPRAFDYGCGAGSLVEALGRDFDAYGGDLFTGSPLAVLSPAMAAIRLAAQPGDAVRPDGRLGTRRVVTLDECPREGSPPEGAFAVVTSNGIMEHVFDEATFAAVMRKQVELLMPGGILLLNANPTRLGHDGHHRLHPWWGPLLHRSPLVRRRWFAGRWKEDYSRMVSLREILSPVKDAIRAPVFLYPNASRARARMGRLAPLAMVVGGALARTGLAPHHYLGLVKRIGAEAPRRA